MTTTKFVGRAIEREKIHAALSSLWSQYPRDFAMLH
jgi:hypothetical protein